MEGFDEVHGDEGGKDDEAGNKEGAEEAHAEDDNDGADDGKNNIVEVGFDADGFGEVFVKGDGEDAVIGEDVEGDGDNGKEETEDDVGPTDGEDAAKEVAV